MKNSPNIQHTQSSKICPLFENMQHIQPWQYKNITGKCKQIVSYTRDRMVQCGSVITRSIFSK